MHLHDESPAGVIYVPAAAQFAHADDDLLRGLETILFLSWDPAAPGPWFARLASFPLVRGAALVTWERDGQPPQLLARLVPGRAALWQHFVSAFFANPAAYHAAAVDPAQLPETITNYRADLLPKAALRAAIGPWNAPPAYFDSAYVEEP